MPGTFNCPKCSAPLGYSGSGTIVTCDYCGSSVIVPDELRAQGSDDLPVSASPPQPMITPEQQDEIKRLLREGKKIDAIKIYIQATSAGLAEGKNAVDAMIAADPELKNRPPGTMRGGSKAGGIFIGLLFFAIASIFPIAFIPMGIEAWQAHQYTASIFSFFGAFLWAIIWGGIGWLIFFSTT